jgi:hypothetical protein
MAADVDGGLANPVIQIAVGVWSLLLILIISLLVWRRHARGLTSRATSKDSPRGSQPQDLCCSFCNKSQRDVKTLIASPAVYICDECVDICLGILAEKRKDAPPERESTPDPVGSVGYPISSRSGIVSSCSLCRMHVPIEYGLAVHSRGLLCPECIGAIEGAIAAERERGDAG